MKIQILYNRQYIAFDLYINSIYNIFTSNPFFTSKNYNISIIKNIESIATDTDFLILFLNDIRIIFNATTNNTKVIFIHADYIINHSSTDFELMNQYINFKNPLNTFIWEYSQLNIDFYKTHFLNKKIHFIPLLYNNFLETLYEPRKLRIPFHERKIDVLFLGNLSPRRQSLLQNINNKYKLCVMENNNNITEYIHMIENSKIILNIYSKEINKPFDYYRFALLYANKILVMNETMTHVNAEIEQNLINYKDVMINVDYDNIVDAIQLYLNKSNDEIETITQTTYDLFKKHDMNNYVVDFFQKI
jgi:hypothetical protein